MGKRIGSIKLQGYFDEYSFVLSPDSYNIIIIKDKVKDRDLDFVITDLSYDIEFLDKNIIAQDIFKNMPNENKDENKKDSLPFNKNFSIIESTSDYRVVEFGRDVSFLSKNIKSLSLLIYGYKEQLDSVMCDISLLPDDMEYHYAISKNSFNIRLNGFMDSDILLKFLLSCSCAVCCVEQRIIDISISFDGELIFNKTYSCDSLLED